MIRQRFRATLTVTLLAVFAAPLFAKDTDVPSRVDWPAFMATKDPLWNKLPTNLFDSPLLGNGMLGAYVHKGTANELVWEVGRADVQDHRTGDRVAEDRCRLPVGTFSLKTAGKITGCDLRLDLWNAVLSGSVTTDKGVVKIRSFIPARDAEMIVAECTEEQGEHAEWIWSPRAAVSPRMVTGEHDLKRRPDYMKRRNPAPVQREHDGVHLCTQKLENAETSTAWKISRKGSVTRLLTTIAHTYPGQTAEAEAEKTLRTLLDKDVRVLEKKSSDWWHAYYPRTFVTLPEEYWSAFYWNQMYKLAAATRPDGVLLDLQGPWPLARNAWPATWWNLNTQLTYSPCYTGNRLDIADSLRLNLRRYRATLFANAGKDFPDAAAIERVSGLGMESPVTPPSDKKPDTELGNLPWTCHLLWRQYRVTMDESILRDDVFPLLRASVNYYLYFAKKGPDGKYHLPSTGSPEYGNTRDCNYDLSLLKWGCQTLLKADKILGTHDPLAARWKDVVENLTDFPTDKTGYKIGADLVLAKSHRHYSHLFMVYPLKLVDVRDPAQKELIRKSVERWKTIGNGSGLAGYSFTGGASILATVGDSEGAYKFLCGFKRFIRPNTMYHEGGWPVIETPIAGAESIHDFLIQSSDTGVRVFPCAPAAWKDAAFDGLLAEGGFKVGAARKDGKTSWVRVESLAGEPLVLSSDFAATPTVTGVPASAVRRTAEGDFAITLPKGGVVLLAAPGTSPAVEPVAFTDRKNPFGLSR